MRRLPVATIQQRDNVRFKEHETGNRRASVSRRVRQNHQRIPTRNTACCFGEELDHAAHSPKRCTLHGGDHLHVRQRREVIEKSFGEGRQVVAVKVPAKRFTDEMSYHVAERCESNSLFTGTLSCSHTSSDRKSRASGGARQGQADVPPYSLSQVFTALLSKLYSDFYAARTACRKLRRPKTRAGIFEEARFCGRWKGLRVCSRNDGVPEFAPLRK